MGTVDGEVHLQTPRFVLLISRTALLFAALEMLLRFGDSAKFAALITRLESMNLLLSRWYGEGESYVEFRDETLEVLQRLYRCYSSAAGARQELATAFRNPESGSIIYYFRVGVPVHSGPDPAMKTNITHLLDDRQCLDKRTFMLLPRLHLPRLHASRRHRNRCSLLRCQD